MYRMYNVVLSDGSVFSFYLLTMNAVCESYLFRIGFPIHSFVSGTSHHTTVNLMPAISEACLRSRKCDMAQVSSAATAVSVGIRQVLEIHQGTQWTNNNICCDGAHLWLAQCGGSLNVVLPSNWVWCPGLFYRPVSCGSWGKAAVWQSDIRGQHILMYQSMLGGWTACVFACMHACLKMSSGLIEPCVISETCVSE